MGCCLMEFLKIALSNFHQAVLTEEIIDAILENSEKCFMPDSDITNTAGLHLIFSNHFIEFYEKHIA